MKTIKAFVRMGVTKQVVQKLEDAGIKNVIVHRIDELDDCCDSKTKRYTLEYMDTYNVIDKIEFLCDDNLVERFTELIKINSKTGRDDSGVVIVQHTESVIPISSKKLEKRNFTAWMK
ncbi:MAG: P-II family nitrogen regulator [Bacteroidota bacterium]